MIVVMKEGAAKAQIDQVHNELIAIPQVKQVRFVTKEQALREMEKENPQMTHGLTSNPLPAKYVVTPKSASQIDAVSSRTPVEPSNSARLGGTTASRLPSSRPASLWTPDTRRR